MSLIELHYDVPGDDFTRAGEASGNVKVQLKKLGFELTDSKANFIFAKSDKLPGKLIFEKLREKGILVRRFEQDRISEYLRITVGSPEEMRTLTEALKDILSK